MEEVEGLHNEYPYTYHHVDLSATVVPWHWHEALEFNYVAEGAVKVSSANQILEFQKGQGYFINSNILATMANIQNCVLDSHLFHPVFLSGHFKSVFETKYLNPVIQNRHIEVIPIRGETEKEKKLLQKLRQLGDLQAEENTEFQTRNLLSEIWLLLLSELNDSAQAQKPNAFRNQDRILTMMSYIQEHYAESIRLDEIAASAAISKRECLRCFQGCIQQSPMDYLIDFRIRMAKKLLETTSLSITEVALRTGFNSTAYFSKMFRRSCGKTPNAYRKAFIALHEAN